VRRSAAGLFLLISGALFAVAISTFWMDRVAFTPSADTDSTYAVYGDEDIRRQVATLVAQADASELSMSPNDLSTFIEQITRIRDGATEMRQFTADAHALLIGDREDPVLITAEEQVQLTRTERVALQPVIRIPVRRVATLDVIASITSWTWLVSFGLAALTLLIGLVLRPERGEFSLAFAAGSAATGALLIVFGYLVPAFVLPSVSQDDWVGVIPRLAAYRRASTLIAAGVFVAIGAVTFLTTGGARQRRQRSTPLSVGRFREQQRWSN